jgi:hypothetical protein
MKKTLVFIGLITAFYAVAAQWTITVTSSKRCIPRRTITTGECTTWTNNISVTAYNYYTLSNKVFFALSAGTSTNAPTGLRANKDTSGIETGADSLSWLQVSSHFGSDGVLAVVLEGSEAHFNRNTTASTNTPWMVYRQFDSGDDWHFAPTNSGSSKISFLEL